MAGVKSSAISRREFARCAAIASAATIVPASALCVSPPATTSPQQPTQMPQLSPAGQAEVESRIQTILGLYGDRFSDEQKTDLRRLCTLAQPPLDRLRAFAVENSDSPALYLKPLVEREKKHGPPPAARKPGETPKKP